MLKERAKNYLTTLWTSDSPTDARPLVTDDFTIRISSSSKPQDFDWYAALIGHFREGIRDINLFFHEVLRDGPEVAIYYTFVGTHHQRVFNIDANQNSGHLEAMTILKFNGGLVQRQVSVTDFMSLQRQMSESPAQILGQG